MRTTTLAGARGRWCSPTRAAVRAPSGSCSRRTTEYTCVDGSNVETAGSANWNLEFAGPSGLAPADQAAFFERFRDKRVVSPLDTQGTYYYLDILSLTRFRENDFRVLYDGTYTYTNTGANTAELILKYDDGDRCDHDLTFRTETSGDTTEVCIDGSTTTTGWQADDRP